MMRIHVPDFQMTRMDADVILSELGGYGRHQVKLLLLIGLVCLRNAWHPFVPVFLAAVPEHACVLPYNQSAVQNGSECADGNTTCRQWAFQEGRTTIVSEWSLVCSRADLVPLSTSVYMVGVMLGALLLTPLADVWGRKRFMIVCAGLQTVVGATVVLVDGVGLFTAARLALGALNQGVSVSGYVLLTEAFPASLRTRPCILVNVFWPAGMVLLAAMAWLIPDWHYLQLAVSLPSILIIAYHWLIPESLPWLISQKRTEEAAEVIRQIARTNRRPLPSSLTLGRTGGEAEISGICDKGPDRTSDATEATRTVEEETVHGACTDLSGSEHVLKSVDMSGSEHVCKSVDMSGPEHAGMSRDGLVGKGARPRLMKRYPVLILFSTRTMSMYSLIVFFLWLVNSLVYYGLSFSVSALAGDLYVNFILMSLVEVPAQVASIFLLERFGRRPVLTCFYVGGGLALVTSAVVAQFTEVGSVSLLVCGLVGKLCVTTTLITVWLYSTEVFPTSARNSSVGLASFWETLGSVAAPFVIYGGGSSAYLGPGLYGGLSVLAGLLTLLLPETHRQPLPRTVSDVIRMKRGVNVS